MNTNRTNMKKHLAALMVLGTVAFQATAQQEMKVDPTASRLLWTGKKLTGEHTGNVGLKEGTIIMNGKDLGAADVVIDMATITCIDLEGGSADKLVGHLKSPDFFNVEEHPTVAFKTTRIDAIPDATPGKPNYRVTGELTIKGITHPNTFDCIVWKDGEAVRAVANLVFDRAKYDIRFRSGTFFPDLGDKVIDDQVSITFDVTAK